MDKKNLVINLIPDYQQELIELPWNQPLDEWDSKQISFLDIRKGISKHTVRFIKGKNFAFAVKQTNPISAYFENESLIKLLQTGIHALRPVGYVFYKKNLFMKDSDPDNVLAFLITLLEEKSIPHSILFGWEFTESNRKLIYEASAELIANLHFNNIYWGDASLSNILVKFIKLKDENGRAFTELKAFLADAETVNFLKNISETQKKDDLNNFIRSIEEINNTLAGKKDTGVIEEDKKYFLKSYSEHYSLLNKTRQFEEMTGLKVKKHFYRISDHYSLESIIKQIEEHKWYLSEKASEEIELKIAACDWIKNIYEPTINEFNQFKLFDLFPKTNSLKLYVDIMAHKYYVSLEQNKDVGISFAIKSYCERYSNQEQSSITRLVDNLIKRLAKIFPQRYNF
ncbi:Hypothetical protein IALB_2802 [Ignavibacterium album JCM 16511]|uniref:DUF4032 domain-containing protein n=1 Tax=Ignavibacterium album (strain DSM 19864 / JCM 16511 / NBRC 101810 / Mat9-16) TaxID=945713 RepID=I0ANE8_IGNAJ|nr:DUF4032 domain-containing protein [Ignavibacterium album]AFH50505.1 Hypothetical protein IALB_2802 [Ignavibacterium album JCM 16511]